MSSQSDGNTQSILQIQHWQGTVFPLVEEMLRTTLETTCAQLTKADCAIYDKLVDQLARGDQGVIDKLREELAGSIKLMNDAIDS